VTNARLILAALLGAVTACGQEAANDQRTGSIRAEDVQRARAELPPQVRDQLDAGNAAFQQGDYTTALTHYREATRLAPELPAGWFGVYMAESALGNLPEAEAAIRRANEVAPNPSLIEEGSR
jgi:Flp pilus assembly protein TadD